MQEKGFDKFELLAAVVLGLSAVGASIASHQSGLWGGQSVEGYGEAAAMTTKASTTYNDELTSYIQDAQVDVRAKEMIWEAFETEEDDAARANRLKAMASWMYESQLSEHAYAGLKLPKAPADAEDDFKYSDEALDVALVFRRSLGCRPQHRVERRVCRSALRTQR
jgi:hypothetical protein